jgi:integrase
MSCCWFAARAWSRRRWWARHSRSPAPRSRASFAIRWSRPTFSAPPQGRRWAARHPVGTKPRLALALLLYTGQRRGDVIRMGRQHIRIDADGKEELAITQQKTGTPVVVPVHPELRAAIDASAGVNPNLTFIVTERGKPFPGPRFTQWFRRHCDAAGLPKRCVVHGLRKAAARRLADAECRAHEIMAVLGHTSLKEAERYTKDFDRAKLARSAMARLGNETATSSVKLGKV